MIGHRKVAGFVLVLLVSVVNICSAQVSGSLSSDHQGGNNLHVQAQKAIGSANQNLVGTLGIDANTRGGPASGNAALDFNSGLNHAGVYGSLTPGVEKTFGASGNVNVFNGKNDRLDVTGFASKTHTPTHTVNKVGAGLNFNDHSASFTKSNIPGSGTQTRFDASANVFNSGTNRLDVNAFKMNTKYNGQPSFGSHGGGLQWGNAGGHGASFGFERTPSRGQTNVFANGNANLWKSSNGMTSLDAFGSVSKPISGPNRGRSNFGAGLGLTHWF